MRPRGDIRRPAAARSRLLPHDRQRIVSLSLCVVAASGLFPCWWGVARRLRRRARRARRSGGRAARSSGGGVRCGAGQAGAGDQLAVFVADEQVVGVLGDREVQCSGEVLVGVAVGYHWIARPSSRSLWSERMKRMYSISGSGRGPAGRHLGDRERVAARPGHGFVGGAPGGRAVAVLSVVEGLKRAGALGELVTAAEALLAEETLVEGVVEVLDRAVAPRLSGRDEHRRGAGEGRPARPPRRRWARRTGCRCRPASGRERRGGPQRVRAGEDARVGAVGDDLDPGVVGADVDLVQRVEARPPSR